MSDSDPQLLDYLDIDPFSGPLSTRDSSPDEIFRSWDEECSAPHAVATILWRWHPSALRAFLDRRRFYCVQWFYKKTLREDSILTIARHDRHITLGTYEAVTLDWKLQARYQMPTSGPWIPVAGEGSELGPTEDPDDVVYLGDCIGRSLLRNERWKPEKSEGSYIELCIIANENGGWERGCDPHWLYCRYSETLCAVCKCKLGQGVYKLKRVECEKCDRVQYCSTKCRREDENVHIGLCNAWGPGGFGYRAMDVPTQAWIPHNEANWARRGQPGRYIRPTVKRIAKRFQRGK